MRHNHKVGDRLFVDYSGTKLCVVDSDIGKERTVALLVAALGPSNCLYAEVTET
jgi:transposase